MKTLQLGLKITYVDEGPSGWIASNYDLTAIQSGYIDPQNIKDFPGQNNEHLLFKNSVTGRMTSDKFETLSKEILNNPQNVHAILIFQEKDGTRHISEGNHRLRAALHSNAPAIKIEIRYFGNSQKTFGYIFS